MFVLLLFCISIALNVLFLIMTQISQTLAMIVYGIYGLVVLGWLVPYIAVGIRRMHDQDKSGWFLLLAFVPLAGPFIILYFMVQEGTAGPNKFGPDPKAGER